MISLDGLNPEQKMAASTIEGPVLILAGAGSGKTRTITYRIAHMLDNLKIPAESILAVSFTNKAALEMKERVEKLLGRAKASKVTLSTFHALGLKILKEDIEKLGYSKRFTIYDTSDQLSIIREALKNYRSEKAAFDKTTIQSKISFLKNKGITADEFPKSSLFDPASDYDHAIEHCYHYYQEKLKFYNAIDFDDILFLNVKLFKTFPELAKKYSQRFQYIMIDEYQDTNELQFQIVNFLTSCHQNLCVVGDDDQSIYSFRGADITNILNFEQKYPNAKVIKLEKNYRSTNPILSLANEVIKLNTKRKDKTMMGQTPSQHLPHLWMTGNTDHEAQVIVEEITQLQAKGHPLSEICILYRSNTQVGPFEDQLRLSQVPYKILGGQKLYEKKEIKDIIAYLSLINNHRDEISLRRVLNVPHRGIGPATLNKFLEASHDRKIPLFEALHDHVGAGSELYALIKEMKLMFKTNNLLDCIKTMLAKIDYKSFVEKSYDSPKQVARRMDDIQSFLISTERFMNKMGHEATLHNYLEKLLLVDNQDDKNEDHVKKQEVTMMTLHSAKGLEFDSVFLVGMEEELLPHKNCIKGDGEIDEERRLCYVGITRARKNLYMSYAKERELYGKKVPRNKSRFLNKLENFVVEQDRTGFSHMTQEEKESYQSNYFKNMLDVLN
jgi:DNA helicase-2/ATP-dependent DNA helicase PcrA